jgi:hypothetical protein
MPQNKILTQIKPADGGIGGLYGVFDEGKTDLDQGVCFPVSAGGEPEKKDRNS